MFRELLNEYYLYFNLAKRNTDVFFHIRTVHLDIVKVSFIHQLMHYLVALKILLKFALKFTLKQLRNFSVL